MSLKLDKLSKKRKIEDDMDDVSCSWSITEECKVKGQHVWTIDNFKSLASQTKNGEAVRSAMFSVPAGDYNRDKRQFHFKMVAYLNGSTDDDGHSGDSIGLFLESKNDISINVRYEVLIQRSNGCLNTLLRSNMRMFEPSKSWGTLKAISKKKLIEYEKELIPLDQLTFVCKLEIYCGNKQTLFKRPKINLNPVQTLADNMAKLLADPTFSDITLIASDGSRFPCHKAVLSARSDVFTAMFSHKEASENKTNEVIIKDMNGDVLEKLIEFIYTDQVENGLPELASGLLSASDKYNIPQLKVLCEDTMCSNINLNNVSDMLVLGHLHEAENLQNIAVDYVLKFMQKVKDTPGWQEIRKKHPKIVDKVLMKLMQKT